MRRTNGGGGGISRHQPSGERFADLVSNLKDAIVWEGDPETLRFTFVSDAAERILGYPVARWVEDPTFWVEHIHPEDRDWTVQFCRENTQAGLDHTFDYRMIAKDGRTVWLRDSVYPGVGPDGAPLSRGLMIDITEWRLAADALAESEARFRLVADTAPVMIWMSDAEGRCVYLNEMLRAFWDVQSDALDSFDWGATLHPDDADILTARVRKALENQVPISARARFKNADGAYRILDSQARPRFSESGEFLGLIGVNLDLTEAVEAQEALARSEARYRAVVESQTEMVCRFRPDGTLLFVNDAYARSRGMTPEALEGVNFWEFVSPEDREDVQAMLDTLTPGAPDVRIENRFATTHGERWTLWTNRVLAFDPDGNWLEAQSTGIDITDRKRAEEARQRLTAIVESSDDAIISMDLKGNITTWNQGAERIYGYAADEIIGKPVTVLIPEGHQDEEPTILARIRRGERIEHYETVRRRKDGSLLDVSLTASPVKNAAGEIVGASKIARDITDRKEMERQLRRSEQELSDFFENLSVGLHWVGPDGTILRANQAELDLMGYSPEEYVGRHIAEFHVDQPVIEDILDRLLGGETVSDYPARLRCKGGSIRDVLINSSGYFEGGKFVHSRCVTLDITERKRAEEARQRLTAIVESSDDAIISTDLDGIITTWNQGAERLHQYAAGEIIGKSMTVLIPDDHQDEEPQILARIRRGEHTEHYETMRRRKDGSLIDVSLTVSPVKNAEGEIIGASKIARDITEKKRVEEIQRNLARILEERVEQAIAEREQAELQLRQAQRMEAVGRLTGGVAHDFNNLLQVIGGNLHLLTKDLGDDPAAAERLRHAAEAVERGARLSSQLLAFGRRQPLEPKAVNLGRLVRGLDDMLRPALGEAVELETVIAGGLWNALVDPSQVENAVLNLAINAADAMAGHGKLTIEVGNAFLDDDYAARHDVDAGQYVMVAVTDTGRGMPPEVIDRVFEPFFTTKPEGQGTGLGLSMVYGFVKQSGGHVKIYSEVGEGTTVRLYLPRVHQEEAALPAAPFSRARGGEESILLVEDDERVRATVAAMLQQLGYQVLTAKDAQSAFAIIESGAAVDLLFTDVVMPGPMRSPELARRARERLPGLAVLFTSGYTENAVVHSGRLDEGVELLSKPYSQEALARKVRQMLDRASRAVRASPTPDAGSTDLEGVRVLVVEDETLIRLSTVGMLQDLGCAVVEAANANEAFSELGARELDILLTDVRLPGASGVELAAEARGRTPGLRIVFASGDPDSVRSNAPPDLADAPTLLKPYTEAQLAQVLRQALSRDPDPAAEPSHPKRS